MDFFLNPGQQNDDFYSIQSVEHSEKNSVRLSG